MTRTPSHLLSVSDLSRDDVMAIFKKARSFQTAPPKRGTPKLLINFFFESSTRTRVSFEIAAKRLGMDVINFSSARSSVTKGEDLADTITTICDMRPDGIVVRHPQSGAPRLAARASGSVPIINAGDGSHEHPTQALLDAFTILQKKGALKGLHVGIIGDIDHSRVARSNMLLLRRLGAMVTVCGPKAMIPARIEKYGVKATHDFDGLLPKLDVMMMLRIQTERADGMCIPSAGDYAKLFQLDDRRLSRARPDAIVMHPGPMNRGVEIVNSVADGPQSVIQDQVANGVPIRMAVLEYLL